MRGKGQTESIATVATTDTEAATTRPWTALAAAADRIRAAALADVDPPAAVADIVVATAAALDAPIHATAREILDRTLSDPVLARLSADVALQACAAIVGGATFADGASIWRRDPAGRLLAVAATSDDAVTRARAAAEAAPAGAADLDRPPFVTFPIQVDGVDSGVLVVELFQDDGRSDLAPIIACAAERIGFLLERFTLRSELAAREQALLEAAERRLVRLAYDLHDGPMQALVGLAAELRYLAADIEPLVAEDAVPTVREGFASVTEELRQVEQTLREVATSSDSSGAAGGPLARTIQRELDRFAALTSISVRSMLADEPETLSDSQRIAIYRVVQEALSNVREHSGAQNVDASLRLIDGRVVVRIQDDGRGFDVEKDGAAARSRGRLGLVGMSERIRLLGGTMVVLSRPGTGTVVELALTPWGSRSGGA